MLLRFAEAMVDTRKRYIFFDYDGTLKSRDTGAVPASAKKALEQLRKEGHFVALATGRLQANALSLAKECGINSLVADGGNSVTIDGRLQWMEPMPLASCRKFLQWLDAHDIPWGVTIANELVCYTPSQEFVKLFSDFYLDIVIDTNITPDTLHHIYKIYVPCKPGQEQHFEMFGVTYARYTDFAIYCEPTAKARGIRTMIDLIAQQAYQAGASHSELPRYKDVVVFGDGSNDLSMFASEWTCVAMGNAIDELKACATLVTTHIDDDGVWNACATLGLIESMAT